MTWVVAHGVLTALVVVANPAGLQLYYTVVWSEWGEM